MISTLMLALTLTSAPLNNNPNLEKQLEPPLEKRVLDLGRGLRCAVCQGLSITDSPAAMARSQLSMVRELVKEGKTDEEVRTYFVDRYGEWALLEPPAHGVSAFAWAGPLLFLAIGGVVIWRMSTGGKDEPKQQSDEAAQKPTEVQS